MPTDSDVSQGGLVAVGAFDPESDVSQAGLVAVAIVQPVNLTSQGGLIAVAEVQPVNGVSQAGLIVVGHSVECSTKHCQLVIIERRDGETFRFTSHDKRVRWGEEWFTPCHATFESATEQSSEMGHAGNVELHGLISSAAITESDLFAGLFDDAWVEIWRIDRLGMDSPRRRAAGRLGNITQGPGSWTAEILGDGAQLQQKALLEIVAPTCSWRYGDANCGVDVEALKLTGVVTGANTRSYFVGAPADPGGVLQWNRGKVRWTSGENDGLECEVMTVDFTSGIVVLWRQSAFVPAPGDTYDLLPGCDLGFDSGCDANDNRLEFGGFPHVPGNDAIRQTPNAKA